MMMCLECPANDLSPEKATKGNIRPPFCSSNSARDGDMTTVYDVPPAPLIERVARYLKEEAKIEPPEWAPFVRTGVHTEKSPTSSDWWFSRSAAVLRKVYILGPIGPSRLSAEFGGRRDDGSAPYHPRKGSRAIVRRCLVQLENLGLISKSKKGRAVTPQGRKLLDDFSFETLKELAKTNPELTKYFGKTG